MSEKQEKAKALHSKNARARCSTKAPHGSTGARLSRLTQARHAALDQLQRPVRQGWRVWIPAGAAAAVAVLAVMLWSGPGTEIGPAQLDDHRRPGLLTDGESPDFMDDGEDLEFYEWAAGEMES